MERTEEAAQKRIVWGPAPFARTQGRGHSSKGPGGAVTDNPLAKSLPSDRVNPHCPKCGSPEIGTDSRMYPVWDYGECGFVFHDTEICYGVDPEI